MVAEISLSVGDLPWLEVPAKLQATDTVAMHVAGGAAGIFYRRGDKAATTSWTVRLSDHLDEIARGQFSQIFLWLTEPLRQHALITAETHPAEGDPEEILPMLGGAAQGEPFSVPGLGEGARYTSTAQVRRGLLRKVTRHTVRWVWRVEDVDYIVTLERDDAEALERLIPDVEELLATAELTR